MHMISLLIFLMGFTNAMDGLSVERLKTEYMLSNPQSLPSCLMVKHRRHEREKVLREMAHNLSKTSIENDLLEKDRYILNKYFFEKHLWNDQLVTIVNTWLVPPELMNELEFLNRDTFLRLEGDGILWQEKIAFFPNEVQFFWDKDQMILTTHHQTYYADYCDPQQESQLYWFPHQNEPPFSTQIQLEQLLLKIKGQ